MFDEERNSENEDIYVEKDNAASFIRKVLYKKPLEGNILFAIGKENGYTKNQIYKNLEVAGAKKTRLEGNRTIWYLPEVTTNIEEFIKGKK